TQPVYVEGAELLFDDADNEVRGRERAYLDAVARRVAKVVPVAVTCALVEGCVADALAEEVKRANADLIVMTTHGRGGLSRLWLGSIADEMVRRSPVPLLLVGPGLRAPVLERERSLRRVLVPLDGSALGEQALEHAVALGGTTDAAYTLLHIVPPVSVAGYN